ncbi:hypothetical protein LIER_06880 [Lithospermum erythrorhizon]|uniref:CCHC-type domain-containing protein n=1 Tax=Lithospermum erythrorhizon TaxID=34254 RepID=A0AAV3P6F8_LITER
MEYQPETWIVMTDQQKGLKNAIKTEIPLTEHRLRVKHLHANWSKKFSGKIFKDMMWEAVLAANVPYFEAEMEKIKPVSTEAYDALNKIERAKWTRCAFRSETNSPMLVNNWVEAFNKVIIKARDQPIITMLHTICHLVMNIIQEEGKNYGSLEVFHVSIYKSINKDPRLYVHNYFKKEAFVAVYSHFLEPLLGSTLWPKLDLPAIHPPNIRVMPGKTKICRRIDPQELKEKEEKKAKEKAKWAKEAIAGLYKASKQGVVMHCKICGVAGHNTRTCPKKRTSEGEGTSQGS